MWCSKVCNVNFICWDILSLNSNEIELFDINNIESKLKKSETEFQTLEGLVKDLATEYDLPAVKSGGATIVTPTTQKSDDSQKHLYQNSALEASEALANAMSS